MPFLRVTDPYLFCHAVAVRHGVNITALLCGGGQESGRRSGTENVLLLVGLGEAAALAHRDATALQQHMSSMRDRLQAGLSSAFPQELVRINGPTDDALRLPNTLSISVKGLAAPSLLQQLTERLAVSAAAACHSHDTGPVVSSVLQAMKVPPQFAVGTLRLSTGRGTSVEDVDTAVELITQAARKQGMQLSQPSAIS
eukprot:jgi/Chrzof1/498/Cz01g18020.t1